MSMTYYAVTDDPNELAHFGVLGMKWGVRHDKPRHPGSRSNKPRSAAYKKAQSKLSAAMRNGIKAVEKKWNTYNSPANKRIRAAKRYERQTNRALEKARKGKLKYGKLTDDQVYRITQRLAMEQNARNLSNNEKTFFKKLRESASQGLITGVGAGVSQSIAERLSRKSKMKTDRMRAEQQNELNLEAARRQAEQQNRLNAKFERQKDVRDRIKDRYEHSLGQLNQKAQDAANEEYFKLLAENGGVDFKNKLRGRGLLPGGQRQRAEYVRLTKANKEEDDYRQNLRRLREQAAATNRGVLEGKSNDYSTSNETPVRRSPLSLTSGGEALRRLNAENEAFERQNTALVREEALRRWRESQRRTGSSSHSMHNRRRRGRR